MDGAPPDSLENPARDTKADAPTHGKHPFPQAMDQRFDGIELTMKKKSLALIYGTLMAFTLSGCAAHSEWNAPKLAGQALMWADGASEDCEVPPSIEFGEDGSVSGDAGCNRILGKFVQNGVKIDLSRLGVTKRMCGPKLMKVEDAFLSKLAQARYCSQEGETVTFYGEDKKPVIRLVPERMGSCH